MNKTYPDGWIGRCTKCSHLMVLELATVNEDGYLASGDMLWGCFQRGLDTPWCRGRLKTLADLDAKLALYRIGGLQAVDDSITRIA